MTINKMFSNRVSYGATYIDVRNYYLKRIINTSIDLIRSIVFNSS